MKIHKSVYMVVIVVGILLVLFEIEGYRIRNMDMGGIDTIEPSAVSTNGLIQTNEAKQRVDLTR